ncbi:MAG TPA: 23S rRNA (uracil(1939)-C(5))-methyltransferase RlmD, partial [bacterium]|nr:23S rRNA (uracil(1939)-C(5))-methyltransferase RlmD [bacterium]
FEFRHTSDGLKIARHNYLDPNRPVVTDFCLLQSEFSNKFFGEVAELYNSLGYRGDDLWQVKIREGQKTGEFMFEIITTTNSLPYKKELIELIKKHPEIKSAFHTVTIEKNIYNLSRRLIFGRPIIYEKIGKFKFQISPESFFQTNSEGAETLYDKIKEFADIKFGDEIIDLFCGTGSIGIYLSTLAKKVTGIEVVPEALRDAKDNAKINKINNCDFICSDVFKLKISDFKFDNKIIIIDPPRAGLSKDLILWLSTFNFKTLVYVSCNPATFARDLKYFSEKGIIAKKIQPIDMFPQTHHVEIISELVKSS